MTRTDPDRVFADAARAELERRVRRSAQTTSQQAIRPARPELMQLLVAAAVGVLIIGVVLGLTHLQGRLIAAPAPVTGDSSVATPAPRVATTAPLIVPDGFQHRSDTELRAWAATLPKNDAVDQTIWIRQQILIVHCMAGEGFLFDPIYRYEHAMDSPPAGHEQAYEEALHGPQTDDPYNWRNAGCTGRAVHETGQDHAN